MAKTAASTPRREKSAAKTATPKTTATRAAPGKTAADKTAGAKTSVPKSRSRVTPPPLVFSDLENLIAPLAAQLTALDEKLTQSVSHLQADIQALSDALQTLQQALQAEPSRSDGQAEDTAASSGEPSETFLPVVADLLRRNLSEHLSPLTTTLRRLEERIGFVSNRLKPSPGGQERQKQWRRDQQPHHFRSRGQGPSRSGQGGQSQGGQGQSWSPPSAASVQGHFAPRRFPSNGGDLQLEEEE